MSPSASRAMQIAWSFPGTFLLFLLLLLPGFSSVIPTLEGSLFPVTSKVEFVQITPVDGGLTARMKFTKYRDCEFLGVAADRDGISVSFEPVAGELPLTLPTGERLSRPWALGSPDFKGIRLRWVHRCNPYWTTVTVGYP